MRNQYCHYNESCKANRCPKPNTEECQLGAYYRRIDETLRQVREGDGDLGLVKRMDTSVDSAIKMMFDKQ